MFVELNRLGAPFAHDRWPNVYTYANKTLDRILYGYSSKVSVRLARDWADRRLPLHRDRVKLADLSNELFYRSLLKVTGKRAVFDPDKSLWRFWHLRELPGLEMRVVVMTKDVRSFVVSAAKRNYSLVEAVRMWSASYRDAESLTASMPRDRILWVKHEELCEKTDATTLDLCEFMGVESMTLPQPIYPSQQHVLGNRIRRSESLSIRPASPYQESITPEMEREILAIAGEANERYGYIN
ncbi:hypothetical protein Mal64_01280 [Pseudobythopirellula maris]|uniref:Sulfotransferase domain protein n=2 Tax=Pseudobythopirellula maris TaxID=2527991 RepID=A0A5C5ZQK9_9BACT|nr:hypothetical protein Mal64_01280 [Pseudobythopirellula maris]